MSFNDLACVSQNGTLDGLNDRVEELILGESPDCLSDINYTPKEVDGDLVIFEVSADVSDLLDAFDREDEEDRQDEKRGLYVEHEDPAN